MKQKNLKMFLAAKIIALEVGPTNSHNLGEILVIGSQYVTKQP